MGKYLLYILVPLIILLTVSIAFMFYKIRTAGEMENADPTQVQRDDSVTRFDTAAGELDISDVSFATERAYKKIVLNNLTITSIVDSKVDVTGDILDSYELTLSYRQNNKEKTMIVPIVKELGYLELVKDGNDYVDDQKGVIPVKELSLEEGEKITLVLAYMPISKIDPSSNLENNCNDNADPVCTVYLELGFGEKPINPYDFIYLLDDVGGFVDFKVLAVSSITKVVE